MRRKDREITDFCHMVQIVDGCDCCRLGLVDCQQAYIVPLNFGYDATDGQLVLYFHSAAEGRKLELLPRQISVSFEMDTKHELMAGSVGCRFSYGYQCVMGSGTVEILSDPAEKQNGLETIMKHYTGRPDWEFDPNTLSRTTVFRLKVDHWSCKER